MNGATGFHHKAAKGKTAGGHFNSRVNIPRTRLCQLSKQRIADALKGGDGRFLERPAGFLRTPFTAPTGCGYVASQILACESKVTTRGGLTTA